jgi:hypothetical protein
MNISAGWEIAAAIFLSLGGAGVIVGALFKWLGEVTLERIVRKEQNAVLISLEALKQELGIAKFSYEKHIQHVVDYYAMFYRAYQLCQITSNSDLTRHPTKSEVDTKQFYMESIDEQAREWNEKVGVLRLVMPNAVLDLHAKAVDELNLFKTAVKIYRASETRDDAEIRGSFKRLHEIKCQLEAQLRTHLRADKV